MPPSIQLSLGRERLALLAPGVLGHLFNGISTHGDESLPDLQTRQGNLFDDRFDATHAWYLPVFTLHLDGDGFSFGATQASVTSAGDPYDVAQLTFDVMATEPPDLAAAREAHPDRTYTAVAVTGLAATLTIPCKGPDGSDQVVTAGSVGVLQPDGDYRFTFDLVAGAVVVAYQALTALGTAVVQIDATYRGWRSSGTPLDLRPMPRFLTALRRVPIEPEPPDPGPFLVRQPVASRLVTRANRGDYRLPIEDLAVTTTVTTAGEQDQRQYFIETATESTTLPLQRSLFSDDTRQRYTITVGTQTRVIVDVNDLTEFDAQRSEYRELTSLGDVPGKYPSLRTVYFGEVSGTVVAIPASYGVVYGADGCAVSCNALVDTAGSSASGCRFQLTFTLAPILDPIDFARLALDLQSIPEAVGRTLQPTLPRSLDRRAESTIQGAAGGTVSIVDGPEPHTVLVSIELADDAAGTPAVTAVNLVLAEFADGQALPLFGQVAVRLDDVYDPPVQTTAVLNVHRLALTDDLAVSVSGDPPAVVATNTGPLDVRLTRAATASDAGITVTPLTDLLLASGATAPLAGIDQAADAVLVQRSLVLPDPVTKSVVTRLVAFHAENVQDAQHLLSVDASSVDFSGAAIKQLDVTMTIADLPELVPPALTLSASRKSDFVHVTVPVQVVLTGLVTTVTVGVTATDGSTRTVTLTHDFLDHPLLVLTAASLSDGHA